MHFIGITGGVGAGKSAVLSYLEQKDRVRVMQADRIAHELMEPQTGCYEEIRKRFAGEDIFDETGAFDRKKLAEVIFSHEEKRQILNGIVHPAVKEYVKKQYELEQKRKEFDFLFFEAALLIEEHYDTICEELWYIDTREDARRLRLKESRGYSDEKISRIFASQLGEDAYRSACGTVIDNNGTPEQTYKQIDRALRNLVLSRE